MARVKDTIVIKIYIILLSGTLSKNHHRNENKDALLVRSFETTVLHGVEYLK